MGIEIIVCKKCGQKYGYYLWGGGYPGGKERETADCPYCYETGYSTMTSGFIKVVKVDANGNPIEH